MENGKTTSQGSSKKRREALLKKRKQRKIRRIVLSVLAGLLPIAVLVFILALVHGSSGQTDPSKTTGSAYTSSSEAASQAPETTTEAASEEPSEEPGSTEAVSSEPAPSDTPVTDPVAPVPVDYGEYPSAAPIEVQNGVRIPSWIHQDLLTLSEVNRPGTKLEAVRNIVIHYVGNTGSSAKENRDYFQSQQDPNEPSYNIKTSSNFVVDLNGAVLQCVPIDEVAYANYPRNYDTISVESCHINDAGEYTPETYNSLVKLSAWLLEIHHLTPDDLITHDEVRIKGGIGAKSCPKWFTDHPEAWEQFKNDVRAFMDAHPDIEHEFP